MNIKVVFIEKVLIIVLVGQHELLSDCNDLLRLKICLIFYRKTGKLRYIVVCMFGRLSFKSSGK